jgi:hypothetical protein
MNTTSRDCAAEVRGCGKALDIKICLFNRLKWGGGDMADFQGILA